MDDEIDYVVILQAEVMTLFTLVGFLAKRIGESSPALAQAVCDAFDDAENLVGGHIHEIQDTGHALPQYAQKDALDLLKSLRPSFEGDGDPKHAV